MSTTSKVRIRRVSKHNIGQAAKDLGLTVSPSVENVQRIETVGSVIEDERGCYLRYFNEKSTNKTVEKVVQLSQVYSSQEKMRKKGYTCVSQTDRIIEAVKLSQDIDMTFEKETVGVFS